MTLSFELVDRDLKKRAIEGLGLRMSKDDENLHTDNKMCSLALSIPHRLCLSALIYTRLASLLSKDLPPRKLS